ncbi:D-alanine--D-alanine ligase [Segetibacter sp. 3557_3]|uniref:D-alanine--D-alanine ligase n=1 Tax=Segetibacter sp. 3557_3 TaxID=2547429 RepID=UPI001058F591|nr:D-alanine--D-alanine ligase [Segetibacter sp. 3557_3]TDH26503.1 D-alanine--D-alanine ligase [Segetibacter sp. 3557_3]
MSKRTIAFVTGGYSGEAVISYKSAITIENNLDRDKFDVFKIDIHPSGWWYENEDGEDIPVDRNDFSITVNDNKITFDAVLIGIHGTPGEDGKLQGYFDLLKIPYTSCDASTSALTFNKRYTVAVAAFGGISVARSVLLLKKTATGAEEPGSLKFPVFVKPNNGGSSIGMSKVTEPAGLEAAIAKAFKEDDQVLVEEFIAGREFTIGVFRSGGKIVTLPITEVISKKDFFDYEAKYVAGMSEEVTPAQAPDDVVKKVQEAASKIYSLLNCRGIVRIDFIYNEQDGQPYMLEVNTVPGQSEASIVPQQVRAMGWNLKDFYTALIEECFNY